jgi:hypothetical protein
LPFDEAICRSAAPHVVDHDDGTARFAPEPESGLDDVTGAKVAMSERLDL